MELQLELSGGGVVRFRGEPAICRETQTLEGFHVLLSIMFGMGHIRTHSCHFGAKTRKVTYTFQRPTLKLEIPSSNAVLSFRTLDKFVLMLCYSSRSSANGQLSICSTIYLYRVRVVIAGCLNISHVKCSTQRPTDDDDVLNQILKSYSVCHVTYTSKILKTM